jgi:predicted permease
VSSSAYLDYQEYAAQRNVFTDAIATGGGRTRINLIVHGASHLASCTFVTGNTFEVLGIPAETGRVLLPSDDAGPGRPIAIVLGFDFWSSRFGRDPSLIGRDVTINGVPATIAGVARKNFRGTNLSSNPEVYLPVTSVTQVLRTGFFATENPLRNRGFAWLTVIGRLREGVTMAQAADALDSMYARQHPSGARPIGRPLRLARLSDRAFDRDDTQGIQRFVILLVGVVALTLLIGCANLANLLLARAAARHREIGVRIALGATRGRLIGQLASETFVLAILGGAAGLLVAHLTLQLLSSYQLPGGIDIANLGLALDATTVLATAALTLLTGVLFGLAPAWSASGGDLLQSLRGAGGGSPKSRLRASLVAGQVALSLVLLAGTGLFLRSLGHALNTPLGFVPDRVATASVNLGLSGYTPSRATEFYATALELISAIPGVSSAAWSSLIPTNGSMMATVQVEGYIPRPGEEARVLLSQVGPQYFRTVDTRIVRGRAFEAADSPSAPRVAIVSEAAARMYWEVGREAIGGRLKMDGGDWVTVVGVAENSTISELGERAFPFVYFPFDQDIGFGSLLGPAHLIVGTADDPAAALPAIRDRLHVLDPRVPIFDLQPLSFHIRELVMPQRMGAALFTLFSVLALSLATIGIYGVASYVAGLRRREIGIRIALGANRRAIGRLLVSEASTPVVAGLSIGIALALWGARFATAFVYEVSPWDPLTFSGVTLLLGLLALVASYIPARRAARMDPIVALRQD